MLRLLALTAAAVLIASPFALAQTDPPQTPPVATQPATPPATEPAPPATDAMSPTPAAPSTQPPPAASTAEPQGCRTRKQAGEPCACRSDTSNVGTATAHPDGHNVCVRPN